MNAYAILSAKFNVDREHIDYAIRSNKVNIELSVDPVPTKGEFMYHYQVYNVVHEDCGDISFKPKRNEMFPANLFTNQELKVLLLAHHAKLAQLGVTNIEPVCPMEDVVDYSLNGLYN